jgi:hypothetical protein
MKNGFYLWIPENNDHDHPLSFKQVVEVIEGMVWLTGLTREYTIKQAIEYGIFGALILKNY